MAAGLLAVGAGIAMRAQSAGGGVTLQGRVLGRILGTPPAITAPAGVRQEVILVAPDGGGPPAVVIYRYSNSTDRLPRSFWNPQRDHSFAVAPAPACAARLRDLIYQQGRGSEGGTAITRMLFARLPGVDPGPVMQALDRAPACFIAAPGGVQ